MQESTEDKLERIYQKIIDDKDKLIQQRYEGPLNNNSSGGNKNG